MCFVPCPLQESPRGRFASLSAPISRERERAQIKHKYIHDIDRTMENPQTGPDPAVMAAIERGNKVVFFDVALGGGGDGADAEDKSKPLGRIKMELFVKDVS